MLRVGLTGGIASGKSAVAEILREHGCVIIEADLLAHEYLKAGNPVSEEVTREFGPGILDRSDQISRAKLGEIVFGDPQKLAQLNAIIHPRVLREITRRLDELARPGGPSVAVVVAALHIEVGYHKNFDRLVVAWCRPEQQIERLLQRGLTREQAEKRIGSQMSIEEKRRLAEDVIDCSGSLEETRKQTIALAEKLKQLARSK
ncbi:MAG TPA: dephospho-CoA kinase [Candidatus Acidoferrales bacterium]|nr:dephospho-CoA kinase [Candidatus Acidoferrales bacterium]